MRVLSPRAIGHAANTSKLEYFPLTNVHVAHCRSSGVVIVKLVYYVPSKDQYPMRTYSVRYFLLSFVATQTSNQ